jgi:hypothetical protein
MIRVCFTIVAGAITAKATPVSLALCRESTSARAGTHALEEGAM